ncbi:MAG: hypothetical protein PHQ27_10325 [Victivallales bacterium]|nr:hypothetical protein [Victivallales bacterium]
MYLPLLSRDMYALIGGILLALAAAAVTQYWLTHEFKSPRRRWRVKLLAQTVLGLVLVYMAITLVGNWWGRREVRQLLVALRQQGVGCELRQLPSSSTYQETENGAYDFLAAYNLLRADPAGKEWQKLLDRPRTGRQIVRWTESDLAVARRLLASPSLTMAITIFQRGSGKPYAIYPRDYSGGFDILIPELAQQRNMFRILAAKMITEVASGKPAAGYGVAVDSLTAAGKLTAGGVFAIDQLVNVACVRITLSYLNRLLAGYGIDPDSARRLLTALNTIDFQQGMATALSGETSFGCDLFKAWLQQRPIPLYQQMLGPSRIQMAFFPLVYHHYAVYLEQMLRLHADLARPYWVLARQRSDGGPSQWRMGGGLEVLPRHVAEINSEIVMTRATLALHLYRHRHGSYPDTLAALTPAILPQLPVDPMTGQALQYARKGADFTLTCTWDKIRRERDAAVAVAKE